MCFILAIMLAFIIGALLMATLLRPIQEENMHHFAYLAGAVRWWENVAQGPASVRTHTEVPHTLWYDGTHNCVAALPCELWRPKYATRD